MCYHQKKIDGDKNIQVVYGFGAIGQFRSAVGYRGIKSVELLRDVLSEIKSGMQSRF